jgi:hypothetical protein
MKKGSRSPVRITIIYYYLLFIKRHKINPCPVSITTAFLFSDIKEIFAQLKVTLIYLKPQFLKKSTEK